MIICVGNYLEASIDTCFLFSCGHLYPIYKSIDSLRFVLYSTLLVGRKRIEQLARNVHYFRQRLKQLGFIVFGDDDSPVVPLLLFMIPKLT